MKIIEIPEASFDGSRFLNGVQRNSERTTVRYSEKIVLVSFWVKS